MEASLPFMKSTLLVYILENLCVNRPMATLLFLSIRSNAGSYKALIQSFLIHFLSVLTSL